MSKMNDPQRADNYAMRLSSIFDDGTVTPREAARAGFRAGLAAAKRDILPQANRDSEELRRRFVFMVKHGMWDAYQAERLTMSATPPAAESQD